MAAPLHEFLFTWKSLKNEDFLVKHGLLIDLAAEKQLLASKDGQAAIVSQINQLLSTSQTRLSGLVLLIHFVRQAQPDDIIKCFITSWIEQLTVVLQQFQPEGIYKLSCRTLSSLIVRVARYPEQSHLLSTSSVPNLYRCLIQAAQSWQYEAARCLLACLRCFPGPAGPVKEKLKTFLIPLLTSDKKELAEIAIRCYCVLPSTSGAGHQGNKHTSVWNLEFDRLLASIDALLTTAFSEIEYDEDRPEHVAPVLPWLCNVDEDLDAVVGRYVLACTCAASLLTTSVPYPRTIPVASVIRTIIRCLMMNARMLEVRPSTSRLRLASRIPPLHRAAFDVLDALIKCCKTNILPYASAVSKVYIQTLFWTSITTTSGRRQYRGLRTRAYQSLITWLDHVKLGLDVDDLVTEMIGEIRPDVFGLKLETKLQSVGELMDTTKKGKWKKKVGIASGEHDEYEPNYDCVRTCLGALQALLRTNCHRMKISSLSALQDLTTRTIVDSQSGQKAIPYDEPSCRYLLYELLRSLASYRHGKWMPASNVIMRIFSAGRADKDDRIRRLCTEAVALCTAFIHPRYPTVYGTHTSRATENTKSDGFGLAAMFSVGTSRCTPASSEEAPSVHPANSPDTERCTTNDKSNRASSQPEIAVLASGDTMNLVGEMATPTVPATDDADITTTITKETVDNTDSSDDDSVDELRHQIDEVTDGIPPRKDVVGIDETPSESTVIQAADTAVQRPETPQTLQPSTSRAEKRPSNSPTPEFRAKIQATTSNLTESRQGSTKTEDDSQVEYMMMSFIDADADSDQ